MNSNRLPAQFSCLLSVLLISLLSSPLACAIDFTWEGKTYRDVRVVEVFKDEVTLESRKKKERVVVPRDALTGFLAREIKPVEEAQKKKRESEEIERPVSQHSLEKAWIHGSASNVVREGFQVYSTDKSLVRSRPTRGGNFREPKKTKGGAPIFNGLVWVKGLTTGENTKFDRVLWRDGYFEVGGKRLPAFTATKPEVELPQLSAKEREWTDLQNRKMTARLKQVKDGKALFVPPAKAKGKPFVFEISKLSLDDQTFIKDAVEAYEKAVKELKKDYPWLKFE